MSEIQGNGFDMMQQAEWHQWITTTIQYAMVSSGKEEVDESELHLAVRDVLSKLSVSPATMRQITLATLGKAEGFLGEVYPADHSSIGQEHMTNVMQWVLKSMAMVQISLGKPFNHERLEAMCDDRIVSRVQGNKTNPRKADMDAVVRKMIRWGLKEVSRELSSAA